MRFPNSFCAIAFLALSSLAGVACHSFRAAAPAGFVELDEPEPFDFRATTADGVVLGVRVLDHQPKGEIAFWLTAIERQMRERGGYALLETKDVKSADGRSGKQLRFGHDEGKTPHLYYVTLFVKETTLYLLEAGGPKDLMQKRASDLDWAVAHFHVG